MKKILNIIILFAAVVFCGCSDFDDSELRGRIDGYKNRIEALKAKAETLGKQLADLSYLTNGNVITTVSQDADGKYVVTYKDNKDVEHTVVLATMDDIVDVPIIGVKLDENGVYYWTKCIDGEITWLTDDDGEKFPVSGYTPTISVDADGCWTVDGVQILDASGNPIKATTDATSVFRSAELDGDGNFSLTLGDGSTITLRVFNSLNLKLDAMPVTTVADPSKSITVSYELSGEAKETAIVAVAKAEGLDAVIDRDAKTVTVSFDASFSRGTVIVMAYDLADNVIVKPLFYKAATLGTVAISTPDQLVAFAAAVNAGGEEAAAKAVLTQDIDMKDVAWTPIGNGAYTTANAMTGPAFQGTFDGQGHAVRNLKIVVPADAAAGSAWGLFGVLKGATVRNLTIGEGSSVVSTAAAMTAVGAVAGYAYEATIENCENRAAIDIQGGGDNVRESAGGIVGAICANENDSHILSCTNYGKITSKNSVNTKNGATGFSIGGIVGFADASTTTERYNNVVGCVNEGAIDAQATRTAGVVATMNKYTKLENCANNAAVICSDVTASNSRVAGIVSAMGGHTYLTSCVNNGTVAFAVAGDTTHGYAAGIAGQTNDNNTAIDGCENYGAVLSDIINAAANKYIGIVCLVNDDGNAFVGCENYGLVITDRANYKGTLFGQCNKAARFSDCIAQGDLGAYEDGSYALVGVNYTNYMSYIGDHNATAVHVNSQNILYYPNGSQVPAEPEFGVNLSSVELNAQGSNAAVVQLSSVDYDWTVSADGDWAHITDLSDVPVVSGVKDPGVQYIKIGADANTKTAPRSAVVTFASTDGSKSATVRVDQQARGEAFPSKWVFQASTLPLYGSSWTDDNVIPATSGAAGFISVVRGDANASAAFKRSVVTNRPAVSTMVEGDYWLYTFPVENLAAGSVVDFNATMAGEANSPKYFIVEYLDGGVWKSVEADLLTAPENPAVRYTYKCSGTATGSSYQHATVMQTMRFENAVTDGEVKIRCRAVGPYTCAGGTQNITATNAASSIPPYGFTGSYVQNFGTATPRDTKKVLCLGNSFSYYSNPAWMLKEIAWREGHALNIKAHFKGSQTLTQHLSLGFSTDVIEQGGYDFAFLQDQSQNPANYGRDATASILTGLTTLADKVRAASPSCKVILEETWTFSSASYGGFTDFPTFETYNDAGAKAMAKAAGTWVSPIGPAFRQVREGGSGINLYYSDSMHQSEYGAYLKACVNYLVLFGERFGADPADCGLNPDKAAYLRSVAEQIVLGNEGDYFIER